MKGRKVAPNAHLVTNWWLGCEQESHSSPHVSNIKTLEQLTTHLEWKSYIWQKDKNDPRKFANHTLKQPSTSRWHIYGSLDEKLMLSPLFSRAIWSLWSHLIKKFLSSAKDSLRTKSFMLIFMDVLHGNLPFSKNNYNGPKIQLIWTKTTASDSHNHNVKCS